nr:hypothetical protein [Verrucomicrobiota bacterium]
MLRTSLAAAFVLCLWALPAGAATPQEVDESVKRAKAWLFAQQKAGTWETQPAPDPAANPWQAGGGQWGGTTALVTYAMLVGGESPQHEKLAPAIEFLKKTDLKGTYALALRAQVWAALPSTPELKGLITKDANTLRAMLKTKGEASGFFDYSNTPKDGYSHSRGNYGVLGMWALEQAGIEVPITFWQIVEKGWIRHQDPS